MSKEISDELFDIIQDYLPQEWDKVVYWALYTSNSYTMKFFVKKNDKYTDCFDIITEEELYELFKKLNNLIKENRGKTKNDKWTAMILTVNSDGKFKTKYEYNDIDDNFIEYEANIKKEFLK